MGMVYHLIFSFPKLLFIEYHTIISEVCFNNREFHSSILGVILCFLGVILNFLSTFGGGCLLYWVSVHHIQKFEYRFIVLGVVLVWESFIGYTASVTIWISIRLLNIYNRKLKMFVEFHNKSMNCCRLLFFCRVAMQKKALKS